MKGQSSCEFVLDARALLQGERGTSFALVFSGSRQRRCSSAGGTGLFSLLVPALSGISTAGAAMTVSGTKGIWKETGLAWVGWCVPAAERCYFCGLSLIRSSTKSPAAPSIHNWPSQRWALEVLAQHPWLLKRPLLEVWTRN